MTNQCLNHRYITYDCCRNCKNQSVRCPEYLSDVNYTRQTGKLDKVLLPVPLQSSAELGSSAESYNLANCCNEGTL